MTGAQVAALAVVVLMLTAAAGYFLFSKARRPEKASVGTGTSLPSVTQQVTPSPSPTPVPTQSPSAHPPLPKVSPPSSVPPSAVRPPIEKEYKQEAVQLPRTLMPEAVSERGSGQLAIIIDDMGSSLSEARSLANIGVPLTFSIIPCLIKDKDVAAFASARHIETMIHIPMQSKGWPGRRLEANGLLVSMRDDELHERVAGFVRDFSGATGANNHMGSEFTEHEDKMRSVIEVLKGRNLFFVDSVTSPGTTGLRVAKELGVKSGRRNVFLDNEQNRSYILGQLAQAVKLAKRTGSAIAICHPHPATIAALAESLPRLAKQGITVVPASRLVR